MGRRFEDQFCGGRVVVACEGGYRTFENGAGPSWAELSWSHSVGFLRAFWIVALFEVCSMLLFRGSVMLRNSWDDFELSTHMRGVC